MTHINQLTFFYFLRQEKEGTTQDIFLSVGREGVGRPVCVPWSLPHLYTRGSHQNQHSQTDLLKFGKLISGNCILL